MKGKIIRGVGGFYYVSLAEKIYECKAKGIFRLEGVKPLVGDDVEISVLDEEESLGNIDDILPRKNELVRPAVANVDQAMVVFALKKPELNRGLLDRFLLMMETQGVETVVVFSKSDLIEESALGEELKKAYGPCTLKTLLVSNKTGEGMSEVREALLGKTTVLAGPSGVGKSSLLKVIYPEAAPEVGGVSKKTARGKHTTRHSELYEIAENTYLFDTPGFSSLNLPEILPEELREYYPELVPYEGKCKFLGCTHIHEPGCAVREKFKGSGSAGGSMDDVGKSTNVKDENFFMDYARYESYVQIFDELNKMAVKAGYSSR